MTIYVKWITNKVGDTVAQETRCDDCPQEGFEAALPGDLSEEADIHCDGCGKLLRAALFPVD